MERQRTMQRYGSLFLVSLVLLMVLFLDSMRQLIC